MAQGSDAVATGVNSFWGFLSHVYDQQGILVLAFLCLAFLFYKLIWQVWTSAMDAKEKEIVRLSDERNFYQNLVFQKRLSSEAETKQIENPP
ncbi:MAG TPA: hypothetical protein VK727_09535 [Steroidobacteraceae bacterium]|nr:hypothetical protein [Steroidobacteraceae bacterium]